MEATCSEATENGLVRQTDRPGEILESAAAVGRAGRTDQANHLLYQAAIVVAILLFLVSF